MVGIDSGPPVLIAEALRQRGSIRYCLTCSEYTVTSPSVHTSFIPLICACVSVCFFKRSYSINSLILNACLYHRIDPLNHCAVLQLCGILSIWEAGACGLAGAGRLAAAAAEQAWCRQRTPTARHSNQ